MSSERLEAIQHREQKATKGPWVATSEEGTDHSGRFLHSICHAPLTPNGHIDFDRDAEHICIADTHAALRDSAYHDAEFIAHAREDIPWLLQHVADLHRALETERGERMELEETPLATWNARLQSELQEAHAQIAQLCEDIREVNAADVEVHKENERLRQHVAQAEVARQQLEQAARMTVERSYAMCQGDVLDTTELEAALKALTPPGVPA